MGLGKTLQVLTWIHADHAGPTLVVCPVTLVDTWARQAAQFTPDLRVATFHGTARGSVAQAAADADIIVTTYGLLARDEALARSPGTGSSSTRRRRSRTRTPGPLARLGR